MIMIFVKGSIYGDMFILIFTVFIVCYIKWYLQRRVFLHIVKWLWYLSKDQYMEMCSFWYLQSWEYCYIKWLWYLVKDQYMEMCIFWYLHFDIYRGEYFEIHKIKWLWYLSKDQYMEMCLFWYLQSWVLLHKMIMIFVKGSIYGDVYILIFTEESIFT